MKDHESIPADHEAQPAGEVNADAEQTDESTPKTVSVTEAKRYRKRAQAAEKQLAELQENLTEAKARLESNQQALNDLEHARQIDEQLIQAEAIDLEATRLLTELALTEMDEPDVEQAVADLRQRKPYLFQRRLRPAGALSPHLDNGESPQAESLRFAAVEAGTTGRRTDLLRYLRLRRPRA